MLKAVVGVQAEPMADGSQRRSSNESLQKEVATLREFREEEVLDGTKGLALFQGMHAHCSHRSVHLQGLCPELGGSHFWSGCTPKEPKNL